MEASETFVSAKTWSSTLWTRIPHTESMACDCWRNAFVPFAKRTSM